MPLSTKTKALSLLRNILDTGRRTIERIPLRTKKPDCPERAIFSERSTPEECGIPSRHVECYFRELASCSEVGLQSIHILRFGKNLFTGATGGLLCDTWKNCFSESKSVISLAIGSLVRERKLNVKGRLVDYFDVKLPSVNYLRLSGITVEDLLTMRSTVSFSEADAMVSEDWITGFLSSETSGEAGTTFKYNSMNSYMLAALITRITGKSVSDYLRETIFGALGITDFYWELSPDGIEKGGWGLYLFPDDLAKLGQLVLSGGVVSGKRLISKKYLQSALSAGVIAPPSYGDFNYGYHMWYGRTQDKFLFNGMLGQNMLCYRNNGIIIVSNCGNGDLFQTNKFFEISDKYFSGDFPESIPDDEEAYDSLRQAQYGLNRIPPKQIGIRIDDIPCGGSFSIVPRSRTAGSTGFAPLMLQAIQNNYAKGLKRITVAFEEGVANVTFEEVGEVYKVHFGLAEPLRENVRIGEELFELSNHASLAENEDGIPVLKLSTVFCEHPYKRVIRIVFDGDRITGYFSETPGADFGKKAVQLIEKHIKQNRYFSSVYNKFDRDFLDAKVDRAFSFSMPFELAE